MGSVSRKINREGIVGVLCRKRFGWKISCAKRKEGDGERACPSSEYRKDPKGRSVVCV